MKATWIVVLIVLASAPPASQGAQSADQTHQTESSSDSAGARIALARAVQHSPGDVAALTAYAEFLDRYGDPGAREAYSKLLAQLRTSGDSAHSAAIAKHLAVLDLLAGDREGAARNLATYNSISGKKLTLPAPAGAPASESVASASIPGPLRS